MAPRSDRSPEWLEALGNIDTSYSGNEGPDEYLQELSGLSEASEEIDRGTELTDNSDMSGTDGQGIDKIGPEKNAGGIDKMMSVGVDVQSAPPQGGDKPKDYSEAVAKATMRAVQNSMGDPMGFAHEMNEELSKFKPSDFEDKKLGSGDDDKKGSSKSGKR
jgi:hypothetical protein